MPSVEPSVGRIRGAIVAVPSLDEAATVARERFGLPALWTHQAEVLAHVLAGRDCIAVLPTGSGKSLCYALPALLRPGLVLVVSPLLALIRDQVRRFVDLGLRAAALDSHQSADERDHVWQALARRELQLLFVSPERLARVDFRARFAAAGSTPVQLVAVDEAHCISHWGSHFRPDYRLLGRHLAPFAPAQTLALTATATTQVRADIARVLALRDHAIVWGAFTRENLHLKVIRADKVAAQRTAMLQAVRGCAGPGIVYAPTRKVVDEVGRMLVHAGVGAVAYHAGMSTAARQANQRAFMEGRARVVVATHAFGLGIDKPDIRFVHHAGLPGSLEQYVQEIGRAGRDGAAARCWLVYGPRDYYVRKFMLDKSYPDVALLRDAAARAKAFLAGSVGRSETALTRHLAATVGAGAAAVPEAIEVLCREGILTRLSARGADWGDLSSEILIADGTARETVLDDYPSRHADALRRLEAMREYVGMVGSKAAGYLEAYFGRE